MARIPKSFRIAYLDAPNFAYWIGVNPRRNETAYSIDGHLEVWHYSGGQDRITLPATGSVQHLASLVPTVSSLRRGLTEDNTECHMLLRKRRGRGES